jgi:cell fate (sporulation/competence/biofilm development) regulator YmcA (YheA/YmcA/DUF963 family)
MVEEKKLILDGEPVVYAIQESDIDTLIRLSDMKHSNLDIYKLVNDISYIGLIYSYKRNPDKAMQMIMFLDENYEITNNIRFIRSALSYIPALEFLTLLHKDKLLQVVSDLLLWAVSYDNTAAIKYIVEKLGPISQNTLDVAVIEAYKHKKMSAADLLVKYGGTRPKLR